MENQMEVNDNNVVTLERETITMIGQRAAIQQFIRELTEMANSLVGQVKGDDCLMAIVVIGKKEDGVDVEVGDVIVEETKNDKKEGPSIATPNTTPTVAAIADPNNVGDATGIEPADIAATGDHEAHQSKVDDGNSVRAGDTEKPLELSKVNDPFEDVAKQNNVDEAAKAVEQNTQRQHNQNQNKNNNRNGNHKRR